MPGQGKGGRFHMPALRWDSPVILQHMTPAMGLFLLGVIVGFILCNKLR